MPSNSPAVLTSLSPGANIGGSSVAVPGSSGTTTGYPSIGGGVSPFMPVNATGQSTTPMTSPSTSMPANTSGVGGGGTGTGLGGANNYSGLWGGGQNFAGLDKAFKQAGLPGGIAALLTEFLQSGAGFNPQVAQALFNAMGPQIERGLGNIREGAGATGNRFGSAEMLGEGDFLSQVNLNMDQIFSQLYEQSVQNYIGILMGAGKKQPGFWNTMGMNFAGQAGQNMANFLIP